MVIGTSSLLTCVVVNFFYFPSTPVFGDEQRFLDSATHLLSTESFSVYGDVAWEMPGMALFLSPFVATFGPASLVAIRLAQALLLLLQATLVADLVRRLFKDDLAGTIAFAITAFYPFFIFYQGLALSETLFNTFMIGAFAMLYRWREHGARFDLSLLAICVLFACAVYTKATLTFLPPIVIAVAASSKLRWTQTLHIFVIAIAAYTALLAPWWIRNYAALGAFVPFTTSASQNLYLGNNPHNTSNGNDWRVDADPTEVAALRRIPGEIERSNAFSAKAVAYIQQDPAAFVKRSFIKFIRYWNVLPNTVEYRGHLYTLISAATFTPVLLLAALCVVMRRQSLCELVPVLLLIVYFTAVHVVTVASLRYRLPLEPFLIAFAAWPLAQAARRFDAPSSL